jgi:hypothetical protein
LRDRGCFEPPPGRSPWAYPICILEVTPWPTSGFNILPREGWSGAEGWGHWIEGTVGRGVWMAPRREAYRLTISAFPVCDTSRPQRVVVEINGVTAATHTWADCEPWAAEIALPASPIVIGWNELTLRSTYSARPVDLTGGKNSDTRWLSVGLTSLKVAPILDPSAD